MDPLSSYHNKRNLSKSNEPKGKVVKKRKSTQLVFVVQKHASSHLHFDFRLEINGVLKSWAIPKGPSSSTKEKRLAILTEDHPLEYRNFEGVIPKGQYGAGVVMLWDKGKYRNMKKDSHNRIIPMETCFRKGRIEIFLSGKRMHGGYALIRYRGKNWLLIKMQDKMVEDHKNLVACYLRSVKTNRSMDEIKKKQKPR